MSGEPFSRAFHPGLAAAALAFVALASAGAASDSITYDEGPFLHYGLLHLQGGASRKQVFNSKLPVTALHAAPSLLSGIDAARFGEDRVFQPTPRALALGRGVAIALGAALVVALGLAARALALRAKEGKEIASQAAESEAASAFGLATALLAASEPSLLAHGHYVTADAPAALATLLVALAALRWARRTSGDIPMRARDAALVGASLGLALLVKYTLLALVPIAALALLARAIVRARLYPKNSLGEADGKEWPESAESRTKTATASFGAATLALLLVVNAGFFFRGFPGRFPESPRSERIARLVATIGRPPLPLPESWLEGLDWTLGNEERGTSFGNLYLQGEVQEGREKRGFARYYLVVLARKLPLPVLVLIGIALFSTFRKDASARGAGPPEDRAFLATVALSFLAFLSLGNRAQIGVRHALPVFPFLLLEAGAALAWLAQKGGKGRVAAAGLVLWLAASVSSFAPDFLPYTNELVLDRKLAWKTFADSNLDWGQSDDALAAFLESERAAGRAVTVSPAEPVAGRVVVPANALVGVTVPPARYAWLRELTPVSHVRHAWLVFQVSSEEAARVRGPR